MYISNPILLYPSTSNNVIHIEYDAISFDSVDPIQFDWRRRIASGSGGYAPAALAALQSAAGAPWRVLLM